MKKKILITGGTGFIGINLIKKLLLIPKNEIYVLTRKKHLRIEEKDLVILRKIKFIFGDIINFSTKIKFHTIYHLAYDTTENSSYFNYTTKTIIDGAVNISKIALNSNCKEFIFLSSGAVYENKKEKYFEEKSDLKFKLFNESNHYGVLKAFSEHYFWSIFQKKTTKLRIYRVFAVIGPYMKLNGGFVVGNLIQSLKSKKKIFETKTDCKVTRNIISVEKLVSIITISSNDEFYLKNISGANIDLQKFLIKVSKKYNFEVKFGKLKNKIRVNYTPRANINFYSKELLNEFSKTYNWYKESSFKKFKIG